MGPNSENRKSANRKKFQVSKSKISHIATFAEDPLTLEFLKSANLRICDLRNLFADRPSLLIYECIAVAK